jgi:tetratricopeptide (TPR) repeat protein
MNREGKMRIGKGIVGGLAMMVLAAGICAGQDDAEHLRMGDEFYARFDDVRALENYRLALEVDPDNYEALWKAARASIDIADVLDPKAKDTPGMQTKHFTEAEAFARKAVKVNPDDTWGHFYLSSAMGKRVLLLGRKEQINASREIKDIVDKALELDPENDLAWHALGRWHRRMAEIGGAKRALGSILYGSIPRGSMEESEQYMKKAVELNPELPIHHLELGRTYAALGKYALAAGSFQQALDLPKITSKDDMVKKEAAAELADVSRKIK